MSAKAKIQVATRDLLQESINTKEMNNNAPKVATK